MPRSVGQIPIHYNHKCTGRPPRDEEKYTSKYLDSPWTPLYPFGHGLSYTRFEYGTPRLGETRISLDRDRPITVEIDVSNTGERAGDEVVQLYVRDDVASVTRPVKQLRKFCRIHLEAGERRELRFTLGYDDLAFYDKDLEYVVEPGTFTIYVGTSSLDVQEACFEVVANESTAILSS
jgi:beta-glucosidase